MKFLNQAMLYKDQFDLIVLHQLTEAECPNTFQEYQQKKNELWNYYITELSDLYQKSPKLFQHIEDYQKDMIAARIVFFRIPMSTLK